MTNIDPHFTVATGQNLTRGDLFIIDERGKISTDVDKMWITTTPQNRPKSTLCA
jgi:hypothetical protein